MIAAAPEVLVTKERSLQRTGGVAELMRLAGVAQTPAGRDGRVEAMDAQLLLEFGPRTPAALRELAARLHVNEMKLAAARPD